MNYIENFATDADGRSPFAFSAWRNKMCELTPELAFTDDCTASAEAFESWRQKVRARLSQLLNLPEYDRTQPLPRLLESRQRDGYTVNVYESYPDKWSKCSFLMLVPDNLSAPVPAVFCFPGSHHPKEALAGEPMPESPNCPPVRFPERNCMAKHYVQAGFIALAFDNPAMAMSSEIDPENLQTQWGMRTKLVEGLLGAGSSYPAFTIYQRLNVFDWVMTLDQVDKEKIAVSGHSLGSEAALFMSVLDDRVKALVFNDFVCDERRRWCAVTEAPGRDFHDNGNWHFLPGVWQSFAFQDLLAACAPKFLALNESGAEEFLNKIRRAYNFCNAGDKLQITYYPAFADKIKNCSNVPLQGISSEEFYRDYCAVEAADHSFRPEPSLKLLEKAFK